MCMFYIFQYFKDRRSARKEVETRENPHNSSANAVTKGNEKEGRLQQKDKWNESGGHN